MHLRIPPMERCAPILAPMLLLVLLAGCDSGPGALGDEEKLLRVEQSYLENRAMAGRVPTMHAAEFQMKPAQEKPVLVDVRSPQEQAISRIPGAVTQQEFEANIEQYHGRSVLTYCTVGERSGHYARELIDQGWEVYNMPGGILAWTHTQQPLETPTGEETRRVHVYGRSWNLAADGYEAVW